MSQWGDAAKKNWADEDGDDEMKSMGPASPAGANPGVSIFESGPDKEGIKTITEFRTNDEGKKIRIIRKVQVTKTETRISRHVLARQKWDKFGDAAGKGAADEKNVTYKAFDDIRLKLAPKDRYDKGDDDDDPLKKLKTTNSIVKCRNCGESGHYTLKCPKRNQIKVKGGDAPIRQKGLSGGQDARGGGKYVPMHMREGAKAMMANRQERDDSNTIRVTNISEETTEDDLRDLFRPFGHTTRVYLAKDRQTGISRGFAFISYTTSEACQNAIEKLNGHGYDNLILHVEFAKPRENNSGGTTAQGAGVQNGAGKGGGWSMRGTR
jgi:translation initiation factor 3 subunit G